MKKHHVLLFLFSDFPYSARLCQMTKHTNSIWQQTIHSRSLFETLVPEDYLFEVEGGLVEVF